jgi:hypothetical protein
MLKNNNNPIAVAELRPRGVTVKTACALLGNKSRSQLYVDIAAGRLDAYKDGARTIITVASIDRMIDKMPRAQIGRSRAVA